MCIDSVKINVVIFLENGLKLEDKIANL
jgi:sRNA-binding regulator protein Hfq